MQPAQPAAQSAEPPVEQEQAQTEQAKLTERAKPTEPPAKRDLRNGDHATVKMKTFACKTMAYFDRWVALMKSNDDEELNNWHERLNVLWRNVGSPNVALWTQVIRRRVGITPGSGETAAQRTSCGSFAGALHRC